MKGRKSRKRGGGAGKEKNGKGIQEHEVKRRGTELGYIFFLGGGVVHN